MAINYPSAYDNLTQFPQPNGTNQLTSPDHGLLHTNTSILGTAIESVLGTTSGTNVLRNISASSDELLAANSGGTLKQALYGGTLGTSTLIGGTANNQTLGTPAITGGTANAMTLGTPTIGTVTVPGTVNALSFSAAIAPGVGTVTDVAGGTLVVNAQAGQIFYCAMGTSAGNRTVGTPSNPTGYQQLTYAFKSSGSQNGTLIWASIFRMSQNVGTPTLGTGTSWNYYGWRYNAIDTRWDYLGQSLNLI